MKGQPIPIGTKTPDFSLTGTDGKVYSLTSFAYKKLLIIIFTCNHCPYVHAYEDRIKQFQRNYSERGVQIVAINSNDDSSHPEDSFERMITRAKIKKYNFPYLRDESQETAKAFGASHTPEVFLFDQKRNLVYYGKIDDNWKQPEKVVSRYLKDAVEETLQNKSVSVPETYAIGCTIKWKLQ